jgi:hypothetical protein
MEENNKPQQTANSPVEASHVEKHTSAWLIVFLLLFFWPLALYFMYKDRKYHSWIAVLSIFVGIMVTILNLVFLLLILPQLESLYRSLDISYSLVLAYGACVVAFVCYLFMIILGIVLFKKLKKNKNIYPQKLVEVSSIIISLGIVLSVAGPMLTMTPIYNLINTLYSGNVPVQNACTMEAKLCPDGSSVGRSGPNCEFSPCPAPNASPSAIQTNWKTYNNPAFGVVFDYPSDAELKESQNEIVVSKKMKGLNCYQPGCIDPLDITIEKGKAGANKDIESIANSWLTTKYGSSTGAAFSYEDVAGSKMLKNIPGMCGSEYFILVNGDYFVIQQSYCTKQTGDLANQILSTLKFTN